MKLDKINLIKSEYNEINPHCQEFSSELVKQITSLLVNRNIQLAFPVQCRIKTWSSITDKIIQKRFNPKSSIVEMQDLIGIRIILLFKQDSDMVANVIREKLNVVREYNTVDNLLENQFGYLSIHQVIELKDGWLKISPRLRNFAGVKAEIQIRTLAQHSWAELSNKFQYKNEGNVPKPLKRAINRISALLETVDLEFDRILHSREIYQKELDGIVFTNESDEQLNVELLIKITRHFLPKQSEVADENYGALFESLKILNIISVGELITLIENYLEKVRQLDKDTAEKLYAEFREKRTFILSKHMLDNMAQVKKLYKGFFYSHVGLIRMMLFLKFGEDEVKNIDKLLY